VIEVAKIDFWELELGASFKSNTLPSILLLYYSLFPLYLLGILCSINQKIINFVFDVSLIKTKFNTRKSIIVLFIPNACLLFTSSSK